MPSYKLIFQPFNCCLLLFYVCLIHGQSNNRGIFIIFTGVYLLFSKYFQNAVRSALLWSLSPGMSAEMQLTSTMESQSSHYFCLLDLRIHCRIYSVYKLSTVPHGLVIWWQFIELLLLLRFFKAIMFCFYFDVPRVPCIFLAALSCLVLQLKIYFVLTSTV